MNWNNKEEIRYIVRKNGPLNPVRVLYHSRKNGQLNPVRVLYHSHKIEFYVFKVKLKENFTLVQVTKVQRGSRGIALLFL